MPRGYTIVWSGWDEAGAAPTPRLRHDHHPADRQEPRRLVDHRPGVRVHRHRRHASYTLNYPAATLDKTQGEAHASRAPRRHAGRDPGTRLELQRRPAPRSAWSAATSSPTTSTSSRYTAKDPTVNGLGFAAVRDWNAWLRYDKQRRRSATPTRWPATSSASTPRSSSQPGRLLNDFRHLGFNQAESGKKVFDGLMQWIAAGDGINMNYRFSQPGPHRAQPPGPPLRRRRVPVRQRDDHRPDHRQARQPARRVRGDRHLPARGGDLLGERVLGEGGFAAAHDPDGTPRPARLAVRAQLPHLEPPARHRATRPARAAASSSRTRSNSAPVQRALFVALDEWATRRASRRRAACRGCATARWCRRCRSREWASRASRASPTPA